MRITHSKLTKGSIIMQNSVRDFLQKEVELEHIPGAVIHVSYQQEVLLQEAIGNRAVHPEKSPMTLNTVFDLASLTKVVATTPAILKLIDDGEIRLDDPVAHFLPDFARCGKKDVTIRHLLTHTSGLTAHRSFHLHHLTTEQMLEHIYEEELEHPIGEKVVYSDLGFIILYKVIEEVTQESFSNFVHESVFNPLGMEETGFSPNFGQKRYAPTEYSDKLQDYKTGIVHDENTESMGGTSGHAGLFSTLYDLQKYASMMENNGVYNGKRILSEAVLRLSKRNHTSFDHEFRGLGWMMKGPSHSSCGDLFPGKSYGHTGFTGTSMWFDPTINLYVILLTNRVHFGRNPHMIRLRPRLHNLIRSFLPCQ